MTWLTWLLACVRNGAWLYSHPLWHLCYREQWFWSHFVHNMRWSCSPGSRASATPWGGCCWWRDWYQGQGPWMDMGDPRPAGLPPMGSSAQVGWCEGDPAAQGPDTSHPASKAPSWGLQKHTRMLFYGSAEPKCLHSNLVDLLLNLSFLFCKMGMKFRMGLWILKYTQWMIKWRVWLCECWPWSNTQL